MRKFSGAYMKTGKYWSLFGKENIDGLAMFWGMTDFFCIKIVKAEWEVNQQEEGAEIKCNMANDGVYIALR